MKICIVGHGYVGQAMFRLFCEKHVMSIKEIDDDYSAVNECDLAVICLPTLMNEDGSCDISIVEKVIKESNAPLYLIKSTIPPGTTQYLRKYNKHLVFSPEYVGEGNYPIPVERGLPNPIDVKLHEFQIFGGNIKDTNKMVDLFTPILGPYCKYIQTDSMTAELVKYMENSYLAMKVVFTHEFYRIAEHYGVNHRELRELFLLDKRCERGHTAIMEDGLGFGGKCLPKDVNAIYKAAKDCGFDSDLLKQLIETNEEMQNETKKDW